jgi:hypothetical protein
MNNDLSAANFRPENFCVHFITEQKIADFCFFFLAFGVGIHIFRQVFPPFAFLYSVALLFVAVRSVYHCIFFRCALSDSPFRLKLLAMLLSLTFSLIFSTEFFVRNAVALTGQFLMCMVFLRKPKESEVRSFLLGFKITLFINYMFSLVQLFFILVFRVNIFYYLGYYIGLYENANLAERNISRVTGLIWDPYVIGMFCTLGFFIFKRKIMKIIILVILFFSYSRAGQVGFFCGVSYLIFPHVKKILKKDYFALPVVFIFLCAIVILLPVIIDVLDVDRGFSRSSSGWRRVEYITKIPEIWAADKNPCLVLFGGAPFYTGGRYMFTTVNSMAKGEGGCYWCVETDWFGLLLGRGIFGILVYISLFLRILTKKVNRTNKAIALAIFVGGVGYLYDSAIFTSFMLYFCATVKNLNFYLQKSEEKHG